MATLNLGRIKPVFRGAYAGGTAYVVDDIVTSGDETFICILASTGNATSNATYWTKLAAKGTDGTDVGTTITTQGDILYRDGSGLQRLAKPASDMYLKNTSAGALSWSAVASNVDIVSYTTLDSTGVNTFSQTTDWSTNDYWKLEVFGQYEMSANQGVGFRFKNASGDISSNDYSRLGWYTHVQTNHSNDNLALNKDVDGGLNNISLNGWGFNSSFISPHFRLEVYKPDTNGRQSMWQEYLAHDTSSPPYYAVYHHTGWTTETSTKTGFTFYGNNSANMKNGFIVVMGHKYQ